MTRDRAREILRAYDLKVVGNTIHIQGKDFSSIEPQTGEHSDGNGGWVAWPGEALLPQALMKAVEALAQEDSGLRHPLVGAITAEKVVTIPDGFTGTINMDDL